MNETVKQMFWLWQTSITERLDAFNKFKEQTKQNTFNQNIDNSFAWLESVYTSWQTATDPAVRQQANDIVRKWEIAMQVRNYAASQWKDRSSWTDPQVINTMAASDPKFKQAYLEFKNDPNATDSTGFAINMWWIKDPKIINANEDQAPDYDYQGNFLTEWFRPIINTSAALATKLDNRANAKWGYEINEETMAKLEEQGISPYVAQNWWAFSQYLYEKYGRALTLDQQIKDEEMQYVSKHPELLDRFINNAETNLAIWEWALDTAFSITAPWIKTLLMWVWETNVWWALLNVAWEFLELWWSLINKLPLLRDRKENLSEEDQDRFDAFVWNTAAYLIAKWKAKKWELKLENSLSPRNIIRNFDRLVEKTRNANIMDIMNDVKWNIKSMVIDWKATPEKVNETAWKIIKWENIGDQVKATETLTKVDTKWVKTYAELSERIQTAMNDVLAKEEALYKNDPTKLTPEYTHNNVKVWWETITVKPVENAINLLKDMYEWNDVKIAELEQTLKKFETKWLTRWEINKLAQEISKEANNYTTKNQLKNTKSAKDIEDIRSSVKEVARKWNEELEKLDSEWSAMKNTKTLVDKAENEVLKAKQNLADKNLLEKLWWYAGDLLKKWWVKALLWKVFKKYISEDTLTWVEREKALSSYLDKFDRLTKRLWTAQTEAELKAAAEQFNELLKPKELPYKWWEIWGWTIDLTQDSMISTEKWNVFREWQILEE